MPSRIPEARDILKACVASQSMSSEVESMIKQALALMTRDHPFKRARKQNWMTAAIRNRIREVVQEYPWLPNTELAQLAGLSACASGRVTDVLNGKYDHLA